MSIDREATASKAKAHIRVMVRQRALKYMTNFENESFRLREHGGKKIIFLLRLQLYSPNGVLL
jgi:hypothetical protein